MRLHRLALLGVLSAFSGAAFAAGAAAGGEALHLDWLDTSVSPARNFFSYANGGWQKQPPDPRGLLPLGHVQRPADDNEKIIRELLEDAAKAKSAPGSTEQKVGDFYASGMDEPAHRRRRRRARSSPSSTASPPSRTISRSCSRRSRTCR